MLSIFQVRYAGINMTSIVKMTYRMARGLKMYVSLYLLETDTRYLLFIYYSIRYGCIYNRLIQSRVWAEIVAEGLFKSSMTLKIQPVQLKLHPKCQDIAQLLSLSSSINYY